MAIPSQYNIGALDAEIFYEQIISEGNLVVPDENTLLDDDELEILLVLRINCDFIMFIRGKYVHISKQTIITEEQSSMVALIKVWH